MAQRKFAAAARRYGGRIPRGAKVSSSRAAPATKRKAATTRKPRAPAKKKGWFDTDRYGWSDARRAAGKLWLPAAQRNRDPNSTVEYGPVNNPELAAADGVEFGPELPPGRLEEIRNNLDWYTMSGPTKEGDSSVMFGPQLPEGQLSEIRNNLDFYQGSGSANAQLLAKLANTRRGMPIQNIRRPAGDPRRRPPTRPSHGESKN